MSLAGMIGFGQPLFPKKLVSLFSKNMGFGFLSLIENLFSQQLNGIVCRKETVGVCGGVS